MTDSQDVAIVGAGIVGLAHAWSAAERGHRVTLFERSARAQGASIRNFGMIWPIGQPAGPLHEIALLGRERWLRLARPAEIWVRSCGSIHLAHRADERAVLREFLEQSTTLGFDCSWLSADEVQSKSPAANPDGLLGGLFSPTELCVNPRAAVHQLPRWLARRYGVTCEFRTMITGVESDRVRSSDGRQWHADRIVICSGADSETLFPDLLRESDIVTCKLQMLKTRAQSNQWKMGPHLASGLTLRHYRNFESCPSLDELKQRIATETPELERFGIHVMAAQTELGEVTLGDSHEYDSDIEPFDKAVVDDLMLRELHKVICLPDWSIGERWHGIYAKYSAAPWFEATPMPRVHLCTGLGGGGMTMSFGIAERFWQQLAGEAAV